MAPRVLLSVGLFLMLCITVFLYWREKSELEEIRRGSNALKKDLTLSRSERDKVEYRLNLLNDDLAKLRRSKEEGDQRVRELDEQLQDERRKLVS